MYILIKVSKFFWIKMTENIFFSIVIPMHDEEHSARELISGLNTVLSGLNKSFEIIVVNDGSLDGTKSIIEEFQKNNTNIFLVNLAERKGQTKALYEGFKASRGKLIISMDGDLQDDPKEIPNFFRAFESGSGDVICGWRKGRKDPVSKLFLSRLGNFFQKIFFRVPVHDISCTYRLYKAEAIKAVRLDKNGLHRFLPLLIKKHGFSLGEIEVAHKERKYGKSKYTSKKAFETIKLFFEILFGNY